MPVISGSESAPLAPQGHLRRCPGDTWNVMRQRALILQSSRTRQNKVCSFIFQQLLLPGSAWPLLVCDVCQPPHSSVSACDFLTSTLISLPLHHQLHLASELLKSQAPNANLLELDSYTQYSLRTRVFRFLLPFEDMILHSHLLQSKSHFSLSRTSLRQNEPKTTASAKHMENWPHLLC